MAAISLLTGSETADGEYKQHTAQIVDWPTHSRGRPWDYGAYGNWNPAPVVHPNGVSLNPQLSCLPLRSLKRAVAQTIFVLTHSGQIGWKHGEAVLRADSWRGPYRMVVSDSDPARWKGTTENAEDPFMCTRPSCPSFRCP